jgi:hypothetical protein
MAELHEHNIPYVVEAADPDMFFVHRKNRGGLGLSWHNVHRNGYRVHTVGADFNQLQNAYAIELGIGPHAEEHRVFNLSLIEKANGLLAPETKRERYLSLGCGHTVGFCKAAKAHCITPQDGIKDGNGKINTQLLFQNDNFKKMINSGWKWCIIPAWVDEQFPRFADVAQKALNASNNVASLVSEIEAAKAAADCMKDNIHDARWKESARAALIAMGAPCAPYCTYIIDFVQLYSGGRDAPLVDFLEDVAKGFQCSVTLGETFWRAVAEMSFQTKESKLPLVRVALILTNLTSPKIEDGLARLLVKSDVAKLVSKAKLQTVMAAEKRLGECLQIARTLKDQSLDGVDGPMGRFFVRMALKLVGKENDGMERKKYDSVEHICQACLTEFSMIAGGALTFDAWKFVNELPASAAAPAPAAKKLKTETVVQQPPCVSLEEHSSAMWRAGQNGFKVGGRVVEKGIPITPDSVYKIDSMNESFSVLTLACDYENIGRRITVELETLAVSWQLYKGEAAFKLEGVQQQIHASVHVEAVKAHYYLTLIKAYAEHSSSADAVIFYRRPDEVRVIKKIPKGELTLVVMAPLNNLSLKKSSVHLGKQHYQGVNAELWLTPPAKPSLDAAAGTIQTEYSMLAYFWVEGTTDADLVNMKPITIKKDGCTIPGMQNTKQILEHQKLYKLIPAKSEIVPLRSAMTVADGVKKPNAASSEPKRKAAGKK